MVAHESGESVYSHPTHDAWVAKGNCPSVHWSKAWCNGKSGHPEPHRAPYVGPAGEVLRWMHWTNHEALRTFHSDGPTDAR